MCPHRNPSMPFMVTLAQSMLQGFSISSLRTDNRILPGLLLSAQPGSVICDSPAVYSLNPSISKHFTRLRQASKSRQGRMLALLHLRHLIVLVKACYLAVICTDSYLDSMLVYIVLSDSECNSSDLTSFHTYGFSPRTITIV